MTTQGLPLGVDDVLLFLGVAGIAVPLLHRLGIGHVLAFLALGFVLGPHGLGAAAPTTPWLGWLTFAPGSGIAELGELGVLFLLFLIGLELTLERLVELRRWIAGLGAAQWSLTSLAIAVIAALFGNAVPAAIVLGACLAFSSTAVVMQILMERRRQATRLGRMAFAVLIAQDLAVIPVLVLTAVFGGSTAGGIGVVAALGEVALATTLAVLMILVGGRWILRPLLRLAAGTGGREMVVALILLVVVTTAALTHLAGASTALGAFLAGVLLAESEYRHEVEVDIEPFKGLLLGVFFVSVGAAFDPWPLLPLLPWILASVVGLYLLKASILGGLALAFGLPRHLALELGLLLGQAGEFAFVVVGLAIANGLVARADGDFMLAVTSLSLLLTPIVAHGAQIVGAGLRRREPPAGGDLPLLADHEGHVVVAGFGRVGQTVAAALDRAQVPWLALDLDAETVARARRAGQPVWYGDASRPEIQRRARLAAATCLVVTLDAPAQAMATILAATRLAPKLPILARARDTATARELGKLGVKSIVPETFEASFQLAGRVLQELGLSGETIMTQLQRLRDEATRELEDR